jgi:hypothetical protein
MAIVYEMNESTGGILVCCEHGVVTHDGSRKDYWVPYDKYFVKARAQNTSPIEEALQSVRTWFWKIGTTQQINQEFHIQSIMR